MRIAVERPIRRAIADEIERLLAILDEIDGDAEDEPELGFTGHATGWQDGETTDDREGDDEREQDDAERGIADLGGALEQCPGVGFGLLGAVV